MASWDEVDSTSVLKRLHRNGKQCKVTIDKIYAMEDGTIVYELKTLDGKEKFSLYEDPDEL